MKFLKKPVEVEAFRWSSKDTPPAWLRDAIRDGKIWRQGGNRPYLTIRTLEGDMRANIGDWIIKGVRGEFYPCKPDIFAATYEPSKELGG